ncbi:MAG TPA: YhcH/YjgK/YiaL family protein [Chitinivibrionales bacterium]|jgi:YhcH/YjgK/YiaL family protein|nr:YhcH/YjgK/YiaL family protein [Chitinivibrionales bacterium]
MFLSSLARLDHDAPLLPALLVKGLTYLRSTDFSTMAPGRYEIDGPEMFALVQEYRTQPKSQKKAESHANYIDVQFVHSGSETIGFAPAGSTAEILEDLTIGKDMVTYKSVPDETDCVLTSGMYAILFPGEIHRPQCSHGPDAQVRKVVLKVAMAAVFAQA